MKNYSMFLLMAAIFFSIPCAHAMELEGQKKENIFDELPLELHAKIIKNMFRLIIREDGDSNEHREAINKCFNRIISTEHICPKKLDQHVLCIPLPLGIVLTYKFYQLQELCQEPIGEKKFAARELFVLPCEQRDVFIRMANRGLLEHMSEGDLSADDYEVIEGMENKNIKKGLTLRLLHGNKITSYIRSLSGVGSFSAFALLCVIFASKNAYLWYLTAGLLASSGSLYGVSILLEICGYRACIIKKRF